MRRLSVGGIVPEGLQNFWRQLKGHYQGAMCIFGALGATVRSRAASRHDDGGATRREVGLGGVKATDV
jgi:hypothetical protein